MNSIKLSLVLFLTLWMSHALATSTGTISFQGSLVGSSCNVHQLQSQVSASCNEGSQTIILPISPGAGTINSSVIASTNVSWLNSVQTKGILTVNYN